MGAQEDNTNKRSLRRRPLSIRLCAGLFILIFTVGFMLIGGGILYSAHQEEAGYTGTTTGTVAMYAEEEARSASENQKWRIQKLYDQGKPAGGHTFGYRLMGERFEVVPEEAEIVKEIFPLYLSGKGYSKIARTLIEQHIPAYFGGTWSVASVRNILLNKKYAGDLLLQKTFSEDFRTKMKRINT